MLHRAHQVHGFYKLVKGVLQNVFGIFRVGDSLSYEAAKARSLLHDRFRDPIVLLGAHSARVKATFYY